MFSNFIYFLAALIIYSTSEFSITESNIDNNAVFTAVILFFIFWLICSLYFKYIEKQTSDSKLVDNLDHYLEKTLSKLSISALVLFAVDLYILHLNKFLDDIKIFKLFPTLEALIFLMLFILYLVVVWNSSWNIQKKYFTGYLSKKSFIKSNISFSLPALIPWFLLSIIADLIELIPFNQPKAFLSTPQGEISYVLIFLLAVGCFGPLIIKKVWGCSSLEHSIERARIEFVCQKASLKYADILKWELFGGTMITAGVMGLWGKFRYILVTPAMIKNLLPDEIDAVIIHEIGHIQKKHIHFYLIFFAGYIASVYSLFDPMLLIYYSEPFIKLISFAGFSHETGITLTLSITLILVFLLYFRYIFGFFMRNFERQADIHVYKYLPDASALIRTFLKIAGTNRHSWDKPNWHHYSIKERVEFLNLCESSSKFIDNHNKKVKYMMLSYIIALIMICLTGYYLNFGQGKDKITTFLAEKILQQELNAEPQNIEILLTAADYYYNKNQFDKSVYYYNVVMNLEPFNIHALNNSAWLYAACSDIQFRDYKKSLELAEKALEAAMAVKNDNDSNLYIIPSYILDTYAEACFVNKLYKEAVGYGKKALENFEKNEKNLDSGKKYYYEKQLDKFIEKLKSEE